MIRYSRLLLVLSFAALACSGCATRKNGFELLYAGLRERPETFDTAVLAGRSIVIDPGHGGSYDGALGVDSLREADANLGVALYLWGLCADAGAEAHLTRTADRDRLPSGSRELADDLTARAALANALDADVFVSIHHNANLPVKRSLNRIEVYYRASDPGASVELAECVQVHLARNLGIEVSEVKPGNYAVLRLSTARAAILGEASYLSHPVVEERLKLSEKQRLEAEAYFLGLVEYFSRGVPSIERLSPARDTLESPGEVSFVATGAAGVPIDPASARIVVGESEILPVYDPARGTLRAPLARDLPNGAYAVQATVRSTGGATARSTPFTVFLARPARHIVPLPPRAKSDSLAALSVRILDELGSPVADGTAVKARAIARGESYGGECRDGVFGFETSVRLAREAFVVETRGLADTLRFAPVAIDRWRAIVVTDARTGKAVPHATAAADSGTIERGDESGTILIQTSGDRVSLAIDSPGYRPTFVDTPADAAAPIRVALEPFFEGALVGRRIAIDPAGGGSDAAGSGANGLRAASVNLAVARHLGDLLERCGAAVTFTRQGDEPISTPERIYLVNRSNAELAVGIRHGATPEGLDRKRLVLHYPASERGKTIAGFVAVRLASLPPGDAPPVREWASVFLQQTACAACEIHGGPIEDGALESLMENESWRRLEAEKILSAMVQYFGRENRASPLFTVKIVSGGAPVEAAAVDVDRLFIRSTGPDGTAVFESVDPGLHLVTVRARDGRVTRIVRRLRQDDAGELVIELR